MVDDSVIQLEEKHFKDMVMGARAWEETRCMLAEMLQTDKICQLQLKKRNAGIQREEETLLELLAKEDKR